jgi:hypothetical protein
MIQGQVPVWLMPIILATQEVRGFSAQAKNNTLSQKYPTQKRAGRVAQVVACLPRKCEDLGSNTTTA